VKKLDLGSVEGGNDAMNCDKSRFSTPASRYNCICLEGLKKTKGNFSQNII
jgi:hypothetical protein